MKQDFRQHADIRNLNINHRAEAALDFTLAVLIGVALAAGLVVWFTS